MNPKERLQPGEDKSDDISEETIHRPRITEVCGGSDKDVVLRYQDCPRHNTYVSLYHIIYRGSKSSNFIEVCE